MLWTTRWCFFAASLFTSQLFAATDSVKLNVKATVETGTCTASLVDDNDQPISVIAFGDAYIPEIDAKTKLKYLSYSLRIVLVFLIKKHS